MTTPDKPEFDRRRTDTSVHLIAQRLDNLQSGMLDMRGILKDLTVAVTKLAVIEERQGQAALSIERAFAEIERSRARCEMADLSLTNTLTNAIAGIHARLGTLENSAPLLKQSSTWVTLFILACSGAALAFIAKSVGLG